MIRATVQTGPKGGVEYRLWNGPDTFRVVSKFKAWEHLPESEKAKAASMEREHKASKRKQFDDNATWRAICAGRGVL